MKIKGKLLLLFVILGGLFINLGLFCNIDNMILIGVFFMIASFIPYGLMSEDDRTPNK